MIEINFTWKDYTGKVFKTASREPFPANDGLLLHPTENYLRVALIDGMTDTPYTKTHANLSGGLWSAAVIEATLRAPGDITRALRWANTILWDRHQPYRRAQQQSNVIVVDFLDSGEVEVVRAGDAWVAKKEDQWEAIFSGDPRLPEAWERHQKENKIPGQFESQEEFLNLGGWTPADYSLDGEEPFRDPDQWISTPVGAFPEVKIERHFFSKGDWGSALAIGTDGAFPEDLEAMNTPEKIDIASDESFCLVYRS